MQNKYSNITFYSVIIIFVVTCSICNFYRFQADMYFDISRKAVSSYAAKGDAELMQWAYKKAVALNPLEFNNYARILNGTYLKILQEKAKK